MNSVCVCVRGTPRHCIVFEDAVVARSIDEKERANRSEKKPFISSVKAMSFRED